MANGRNMSAAITGLVGLALGAVAASMVMGNRDRNKQIKGKLKEWKEKGQEKMEEVKKKMAEQRKEAEKRAEQSKKAADEARREYQEEFEE